MPLWADRIGMEDTHKLILRLVRETPYRSVASDAYPENRQHRCQPAICLAKPNAKSVKPAAILSCNHKSNACRVARRRLLNNDWDSDSLFAAEHRER